MRIFCAALTLCAIACGSTAPSLGPDGGPAPDGGIAADGGPVADGGPAPDGGTAADGGPAPDGGAANLRILPAMGLDVASDTGGTAALRIGQTLAAVRPLVGEGQDSGFFPGPFDRRYAGGFALIFANTDQSEVANTPTLTDADVLRFLSAGPTFAGRTLGGTGPGSSRSAWRTEFGDPDVTLVGLDDPALTNDYYFAAGLVVTYGTSSGVATNYTVQRSARRPDVRLQLRNRRLGEVRLDSGGSGSDTSVILREWGEPDQVDDFEVFLVTGRNYVYVGLGLMFVTQVPVLGGDYRATGAVVFDPYYGKTDFANLGVRSPKSEFDARMTSGQCPSLTKSLGGRDWIVYRLAEGRCEVRLGVSFDGAGRARFLYLNIP